MDSSDDYYSPDEQSSSGSEWHPGETQTGPSIAVDFMQVSGDGGYRFTSGGKASLTSTDSDSDHEEFSSELLETMLESRIDSEENEEAKETHNTSASHLIRDKSAEKRFTRTVGAPIAR
jgi:hypothetical protein